MFEYAPFGVEKFFGIMSRVDSNPHQLILSSSYQKFKNKQISVNAWFCQTEIADSSVFRGARVMISSVVS